mgnify:CR=1 FL=1
MNKTLTIRVLFCVLFGVSCTFFVTFCYFFVTFSLFSRPFSPFPPFFPFSTTRHRHNIQHNELVELGIVDAPLRTIILPALDETAVQNIDSFYRKTARGQSDPSLEHLFENVLDNGPDRLAALLGRSDDASATGSGSGSSSSAASSAAEVPVSEMSKQLEGMMPVKDAEIVTAAASAASSASISAEERAAREQLEMRALVQATVEDEYTRDKYRFSVDAIMSLPEVDSERDNYMFQFPAAHQVDYSVDRLCKDIPST